MTAEIHYVGAYEESYARHRVLQQGFRDLGISVSETRDRSLLPLRWIRLSKALLSMPADVPVIVGEAGNFLTPVLWCGRALGRPAVFDTFVSLRDTVLDRHSGPAVGPVSRIAALVDRLNCHAASWVIVDSMESKRYFSSVLGVDARSLEVVHVGAETNLFQPSMPAKSPRGLLRVLFVGTFIPLHGVSVILRAAAQLQDSAQPVQIRLVGSGQELAAMRRLARSLRLTNVVFGPSSIPYRDLPKLIWDAHVCLGIFADRPKTRRVIPHKVFQAAACGRPVVTADTPAIREVFSNQNAALVPAGNPDALASELSRLAHDERRRVDLAERAAVLIHEEFAPSVLASRIITRLEASRA